MYNKIKRFCDEQNITIHQMCAKLGISDAVLSNLKNRENQKGLSAENAVKIADYMGISVGELINKKDKAIPLYYRDLDSDDNRNLIDKVHLTKEFGRMTVAELQNYLHFASKTDEEKIDLIAFERILRRIEPRAIEFEKILERRR